MNTPNIVTSGAAAILVALVATGCSGSSAQKTPAPPAGAALEQISADADAAQAASDAKAAAADAKEAAAEAAEPVGGIVGERLVQATATVMEIDLATRHVNLERADGTLFTVVCGEGVRNLPLLRQGDSVTVSYYQSMAYEVKKPGDAEPSAEAAGVVVRTVAASKPGGMGAQVVKVTATIVGIDRAAMYVTLKGPDGALTAVRVYDAEKLARVAVGDLVEITLREALAVSVERPDGK